MIIDKKDTDILNILLENSRLSYRQIAKKANISVATVMHRVNRLEKEKIIKKFTTKIDYEQLGYDMQVIIDVRVSKGKLFEVEKKIAKHPNVTAVYDITGDFDVAIVAKFKNRKALDNFIKKLQTFDFVERTQTKLILNAIKEDGIPL